MGKSNAALSAWSSLRDGNGAVKCPAQNIPFQNEIPKMVEYSYPVATWK
jgi:hypothetical protein